MARHHVEHMETAVLVLDDVEDIKGALGLEEAELESVLAVAASSFGARSRNPLRLLLMVFFVYDLGVARVFCLIRVR